MSKLKSVFSEVSKFPNIFDPILITKIIKKKAFISLNKQKNANKKIQNCSQGLKQLTGLIVIYQLLK